MIRHERVARIARENKVEANTQKPHLWPDRAPMLSHGVKKLVGKRIARLNNTLGKSAQLGPDGYAALACGTISWGNDSLSWELRTYDQHLLYRDFDNQVGDDKTRVIFVLTAKEALENLAQEQARHAALRALYLPPETPPKHSVKRPFRSKRRSAARSRASAQD